MSKMISGGATLYANGVLDWDMDRGFFIWKDGESISVSELLTPFLSQEIDFQINSDSLRMISAKLSDTT